MLYGTTISILYSIGENVVVIFNVYGALAMFILFCDLQDTEYFSLKKGSGVARPMLTQKQTRKTL